MSLIIIISVIQTPIFCKIPGLENDEEIRGLEQDIKTIQEENAKLESQMEALRSDINDIEAATSMDINCSELEEQTSKLNDYLASLRNSVVSHLREVPSLPDMAEPLEEGNVESFLQKLRGCVVGESTENHSGTNGLGGSGNSIDSKAVCEAVKQALTGIEV